MAQSKQEVLSRVHCDCCSNEIKNFRYKCISCDEFNLCAICEYAEKHKDHYMVRLPAPNSRNLFFDRHLLMHLLSKAGKKEESLSLFTTVHPRISCKGCGRDKLQGFRYKCISCDNFDLCAACEREGKHSEHFMVRLPTPIIITSKEDWALFAVKVNGSCTDDTSTMSPLLENMNIDAGKKVVSKRSESAHYSAKVASALQLNATLLQQLECPVCMDMCKPPIYMCIHGHHVCSRCQHNLTACPVCRTIDVPTIRCIALEAICAQVLLPCKYQRDGCHVEKNLADIEVHNKICEFRFQCPVPDCRWVGQRIDLLKHCKANHSVTMETPTQPFAKCTYYDSEIDKRYLQLFQFDNELFAKNWRLKNADSSLYFFCWFFGPKERSELYRYVVTLVSPERSKSLIHIGPMQSPDEDYKRSANCFKICFNDVDNFSDRASQVLVKGFIEYG